MNLTETKEGTVIEVFVKPRARSFSLEMDGDDVVVSCCGEPVEGKVNREIVKELSRFFKSRVELVSGFSSKRKRFLIKGLSSDQVELAIARR